MYRIITIDDILDVFLKGKQRGINFIASKFTFNKRKRTESAFNKSAEFSSNWWIIPHVRERWNSLITGNHLLDYKEYLIQGILKERTELKLLSLGSGSCGNEIELAKYKSFKTITCVDISEYRLSEAKRLAKQEGLNNLKFVCSDINKYLFQKKSFDIIFFNSSLHHFNNVETLISQKILSSLTDTGILIINEYVGPDRLQFPKNQIREINNAIRIIPKRYRKRYKSTLNKNFFFGYGIIRMIIADPSECIDSSSILPSIHKYFNPIIEKPYGGNILMNVLKDISHNFIHLNDEKKEILNRLFNFEDEYLKTHSSDFIFGIYKKKAQLI
jgi:ubiquinone/menaquinone biosynthesis C-methylase UbiE